MSRLVARILGLTMLAFMLAPVGAAAATDHYYSSQGVTDVKAAAAANNSCASLTNTRLAAFALAIGWHEPSASELVTPSPMTMGRADNDADLYWKNLTTANSRKAFWHPGVGVFQLDDSGMGSSLAYEKFHVRYSADKATKDLSARWCSRPGDYTYLFAPWFGCSRDSTYTCTQSYSEIYASTSNTLVNLKLNTAVTSLGGTVAHSCSYYGQTTTFTCYFVNPTASQGDGAWKVNPNGTPPLAWPFYIYRLNVNGVNYEYRSYPKQYTGGVMTVSPAMRRAFGSNSRSGLYDFDPAPKLCDVTNGFCWGGEGVGGGV